MIALFVIPHMVHASPTNSKIQGKYRHLLAEIWRNGTGAWYIAPPTLVALITIRTKGNLTSRERRAGGREVRRLGAPRPYIFLVCLTCLARRRAYGDTTGQK